MGGGPWDLPPDEPPPHWSEAPEASPKTKRSSNYSLTKPPPDPRPPGCQCRIETEVMRRHREEGLVVKGRVLTSSDHRLVRKPMSGCPVHPVA